MSDLVDEDDQDVTMSVCSNDSSGDMSTDTFNCSDSCVALHVVGDRVVVGSMDDNAYVVQLVDGVFSPGQVLKTHSDTVSCITGSTDGETIFTGSYDSSICVWSSSSGELHCQLEGPSGEIEWIGCTPQGSEVLAGCSDGSCWLFRLASDKSYASTDVLSCHSQAITGGAITKDGKLAITISLDGTAAHIDVLTGKIIGRVKVCSEHGAVSIACHPTLDLSIVGCEDGSLVTLHSKTAIVLGSLSAHTGSVESMQFNHDASLFASGSVDGMLQIWHASRFTGPPRIQKTIEDGGISCLCFHPMLDILAVGTANGPITVLSGLSGEVLARFTGHEGTINDVRIMTYPKYSAIFSAGDDNKMNVYVLEFEATDETEEANR